MDPEIYDRSAPRKAANLSINADLLEQARKLDVNLSRLLEERLTEVVREAKQRQWREQNEEAIAAYNRRIEARGSFGDRMRRF